MIRDKFASCAANICSVYNKIVRSQTDSVHRYFHLIVGVRILIGYLWEATATEAAELGRDVIGLYITAADGSRNVACCITDQLVTAFQNVVYSLDDRWKRGAMKPPVSILTDNAFYEIARTHASIRLASNGTADLFGMTSVTRTVRLMAQLIEDTRDLMTLRARLDKLPAKAIMAYERFLTLLLQQADSVRIEWAAPSGEQSRTELNLRQMQTGCSFINAVTETVTYIRVRGSLTTINPAKRTFRIESETGHAYTGRLSDAVRKQYSQENNPQVPVKAEALIERRTTFQASIKTESVVDTLVELDANLGLDIRETLYTLKELYGRLVKFVERDSNNAGRLCISIEDYTALTGLFDQLDKSNPSKGARCVLEPADVAVSHSLLAEGRPISRLAKFDPQGLYTDHDLMDQYESNPAARSARLKAADRLTKLASAAYPDIAILLKRLLKMIDTLENQNCNP